MQFKKKKHKKEYFRFFFYARCNSSLQNCFIIADKNFQICGQNCKKNLLFILSFYRAMICIDIKKNFVAVEIKFKVKFLLLKFPMNLLSIIIKVIIIMNIDFLLLKSHK